MAARAAPSTIAVATKESNRAPIVEEARFIWLHARQDILLFSRGFEASDFEAMAKSAPERR